MRGGKIFRILATRAEMGRLVTELSDALKRCDEGTLPILKAEASPGVPLCSRDNAPLWGSHATLFKERTADVGIGFELVPSLDDAHEIIPKRWVVMRVLGFLFLAFVMVVGVISVLRWLIPSVLVG